MKSVRRTCWVAPKDFGTETFGRVGNVITTNEIIKTWKSGAWTSRHLLYPIWFYNALLKPLNAPFRSPPTPPKSRFSVAHETLWKPNEMCKSSAWKLLKLQYCIGFIMFVDIRVAHLLDRSQGPRHSNFQFSRNQIKTKWKMIKTFNSISDIVIFGRAGNAIKHNENQLKQNDEIQNISSKTKWRNSKYFIGFVMFLLKHSNAPFRSPPTPPNCRFSDAHKTHWKPMKCVNSELVND